VQLTTNLETEHDWHHVLSNRCCLREGPLVPTRTTAKRQGDVLLCLHRVGHWIAGELRSGFKALQLLDGVLIKD
jgi:hypothetical protein